MFAGGLGGCVPGQAVRAAAGVAARAAELLLEREFRRVKQDLAAPGGVGFRAAQRDMPQHRQLVRVDQRERIGEVIADDERLEVRSEGHAPRVGLRGQASERVVRAGAEIFGKLVERPEPAAPAEALETAETPAKAAKVSATKTASPTAETAAKAGATQVEAATEVKSARRGCRRRRRSAARAAAKAATAAPRRAEAASTREAARACNTAAEVPAKTAEPRGGRVCFEVPGRLVQVEHDDRVGAAARDEHARALEGMLVRPAVFL